MNVKENIGNILQAVGAPVTKVDLARPEMLLAAVRQAVVQQLQNDSTGTKRVFTKNVVYDFNAILQFLSQTTNLSDENCATVLNAMCQNVDGVTDLVLHGMVQGLPEQDDMTPKLAEQSAAVLTQAMQADYHAYLQANGISEQRLSYADYQNLRACKQITSALVQITGDAKQAADFLAQPIDETHPIFQHTAMREKFLTAKAARAQDGSDQVRVIDVLMTMSKSITKAQVLAFYENRVNEQNQIGEHGERLSDNSPTKIDKALGSAGRQATEQAIGQPLTKKLMSQVKPAGGKPLPDHKWRGFQRLAKLIGEVINTIYGTVSSGGFVEKLVKRALAQEQQGTAENNLNPANLPWETQYQPLPAAYENTSAGTFFTHTQARMLADKLKITRLSTNLQQELQPDYTLEDVVAHLNAKQAADQAEAEKTTPDNTQDQVAATVTYSFQLSDQPKVSPAVAKLDRCAQLYEQIAYLQKRVVAAEKALADLQQASSQDASVLQDDNLMTQLNQNIVGTGEDATATEYLVSALRQFLHFNNAEDDLQQAASYEMLADLFSIRDQFDQGQVTVEDLQGLLRAVPFNPDKANAMIVGLQTGKLSPEMCRQVLHDSANTFLKNKYIEAYTNYDLQKTADDAIRNM